MAWDFYTIMVSIVGVPDSQFESAILYILSATLGLSLILFVFRLFDIATSILKPK